MKRELKILLYSSNIWYFADGLLGPLFAIFAERLGGDILEITWAWATYLIVDGLLVIYIGRLSDKLGKEKIMVAGYALDALFTFGYLFVSTPLHLFIIQAGLGVANALNTPTWNALYAKHYDRRHSGLCWGLATGEAHLVTAAAIVVGGFIVNSFSFTVLFALMGTLQVVATFYQAQILWENRK